ncbi:MAG: hypothetical protein HY078_11400 [Elusimicrobia bacterium]|nr:hypothetical protein [Elusimicrobiota bacterium]
MMIPWVFFLKEDEQLLIEGLTTRWTIDGPRVYVTPPLHWVTRRKGTLLGPMDYARVRDTLTGDLKMVRGPTLLFLKASEEVLETLSAITLKKGEYVRLLDGRTGVIRVERGEQTVYLGPTEKALEAPGQRRMVCEAVNIGEDLAVVLRDRATGGLQLVTEPQAFVPAPNEEIVEVSRRVRLEDHETVVIKDKDGRFSLRRGTDEERSFFLPPFSELVSMRWSTGVLKNERGLEVTHLDTRPKFMWFQMTARTQDNVELLIDITFFWQIVDVEKMIRTTDDAPGDTCSHARSAIIQAVSQTTLEEFLAKFNGIVRDAVMGRLDAFYAERGVVLHAVEVRSVSCKDAATQNTLAEIIQETTDRLNRLQKQESENEVKLKQLSGEMEAESLRGRLLEMQREHVKAEGQMAGEAEALRVNGFLDGLNPSLSAEDKVELFRLLRKQEALDKLSRGTAQLYFTPADVNLSIETHGGNGHGKSR